MCGSGIKQFICLVCLFIAEAGALSCVPTTQKHQESSSARRRSFIISGTSLIFSFGVIGVVESSAASAAVLTPGGTLVDRNVGIRIGNSEASASRSTDNSNVLFVQDYYFKFGNAAQWIEPGNTDFPKTMPFTMSQQRYDALKKYGDRVNKGIHAIDSLRPAIEMGNYDSDVSDASSSEYALRPMGLMANSFLASENTGVTNELFLARWYINEMYLAIGDIRGAQSKDEALASYRSAKKAANSYLGMMNRVITPKVGEKFALLS